MMLWFMTLPNSIRVFIVLFAFGFFSGMGKIMILSCDSCDHDGVLPDFLGEAFYWMGLSAFLLLVFYNIRLFCGAYKDIKPASCRKQLW